MNDIRPHGLHHVTAIASDPQRNVDFYTRVLGLRLVKQTVNFDAPDTYHLYYGDQQGHPSTLLTFFPWRGVPKGKQGTGLTTATAFSVPPESLGWWQRRLAGLDVDAETPRDRDGEEVLTLRDPDGLVIDLVASPGDTRSGWDGVARVPDRARRARAVLGDDVRAAARPDRADARRDAGHAARRRGRRPCPVRDGRRRCRRGRRRGRRRRSRAACRPVARCTTSPSAHPTAQTQAGGGRSSSTPGCRSPRSSTVSTSPRSTSGSPAGCCWRSPPTSPGSPSTSRCSNSAARSSCRRGWSPAASRSRPRYRRCVLGREDDRSGGGTAIGAVY